MQLSNFGLHVALGALGALLGMIILRIRRKKQ